MQRFLHHRVRLSPIVIPRRRFQRPPIRLQPDRRQLTHQCPHLRPHLFRDPCQCLPVLSETVRVGVVRFHLRFGLDQRCYSNLAIRRPPVVLRVLPFSLTCINSVSPGYTGSGLAHLPVAEFQHQANFAAILSKSQLAPDTTRLHRSRACSLAVRISLPISPHHIHIAIGVAPDEPRDVDLVSAQVCAGIKQIQKVRPPQYMCPRCRSRHQLRQSGGRSRSEPTEEPRRLVNLPHTVRSADLLAFLIL